MLSVARLRRAVFGRVLKNEYLERCVYGDYMEHDRRPCYDDPISFVYPLLPTFNCLLVRIVLSGRRHYSPLTYKTLIQRIYIYILILPEDHDTIHYFIYNHYTIILYILSQQQHELQRKSSQYFRNQSCTVVIISIIYIVPLLAPNFHKF